MKKIVVRMFIFIYAFFILYTIAKCGDNDEITSRFRKMIETAHPVPMNYTNNYVYSPLTKDSVLPYFLNVNLIDAENGESYKMQNESSIAVNPKNPINLIGSAVDYRGQSSTWVYVSHDGGLNWVNINLGKPFPYWYSTNDPSVAFDNDGTGYLVYGGMTSDTLPEHTGENGVLLARTTDEGKTWKAHIPVILHKGAQTLDSTFEDKYYIQVDNSSSSPYYHDLYIPWKRVTAKDSATQIVITKSNDRGETWSIPKGVSDRLTGSSEDTTYGQSFPLTVTGPEGEVYVVWNHGIEHGIGFVRSTDGGNTFTQPKIIMRYNIFGETKFLSSQKGYRHCLKGMVRAETYPVIACDIGNSQYRGNLYLTWAGDRTPNIYFSRSADKGETWSQPVIVHSDTTNDQFWQWLAVDNSNGDLAIMYLDSRNDPNNLMSDCYASYSSDAGATWHDRRISDVAGDLRQNPFFGNFAGDYSGCAFYKGKIYPSWIDMRNAVNNIFDSDVFTGIINVNALMPPENFKANVIPDNPFKLNLSWDKPKTRAFGQEIKESDYSYMIYRSGGPSDPPSGLLLGIYPGSSVSLDNNNLSPHTKYHYKICTITGNDTSIFRETYAYSGGSRKPASPILDAGKNMDFAVLLNVKIPGLRSDSLTPFVNPGKVKLYRDSVMIRELPISISDTGKGIAINDTVETRGYYRYYTIITDKPINPDTLVNESEKSNEVEVFAGTIPIEYTENFDGGPHHLSVRGGWAVTNKFFYSAPNSITESPFGNYPNNHSDTLMLFPLNISENYARLTFRHAVYIEPRDTGFIEYSTNNGNGWKRLASFNNSNYPQWQDNTKNSDDWVPENFDIPSKNEIIWIRFIFISNLLKSDDGWYIDDIEINPSGSLVAENEGGSLLKIYPNPAGSFVTIFYPEITGFDLSSSIIISPLGKSESLGIRLNEITQNTAKFDLTGLSTGVYFIILKNNSGKSYFRKIILIK